MTLDPKTLTQEERAIVDAEVGRLRALGPGRLAQPEKVYLVALANMEHPLLARRALFGQEPAPALRMTPELERVLAFATFAANKKCDKYARPLTLADIQTVRAQASQPVKLERVRAYFDSLRKLPQYHTREGRSFLDGVFAELDAVEGKG